VERLNVLNKKRAEHERTYTAAYNKAFEKAYADYINTNPQRDEHGIIANPEINLDGVEGVSDPLTREEENERSKLAIKLTRRLSEDYAILKGWRG
jgi:hypothetical protein